MKFMLNMLNSSRVYLVGKLTQMLFMFLLLFSGCSDQLSEDFQMEMNKSSDVIPMEEALAKLDAQMKIFYGDPTKGELPRKYDHTSVSALTKYDLGISATKGFSLDFPDSLLYLINFDGDNGYAVLPAARSIDNGVFCITEGGNISSDDFVSAFEVLKNGGNGTGIASSDKLLIVPELILSELILELEYGVKIEDENVDETKSAPAGTLYGPYLKTKWGQASIHGTRVWNRYTPNHALAGCVVTATAQIMVYNKHNNTNMYDGVVCDFQGMESVYHYSTLGFAEDTTYYDQVAHFVRELGNHNQCRITYGSSEGAESSGYAEGAQRALQYYGYNDVDKHLGFGRRKQKIATKVIRKGRPVYLDGATDFLDHGLNTTGHAWVLDGECGEYYHINWGWNGYSDGYFKKGTFSTTDRYSVDDLVDTATQQVSAQNYTWDYRLVTYGDWN